MLVCQIPRVATKSTQPNTLAEEHYFLGPHYGSNIPSVKICENTSSFGVQSAGNKPCSFPCPFPFFLPQVQIQILRILQKNPTGSHKHEKEMHSFGRTCINTATQLPQATERYLVFVCFDSQLFDAEGFWSLLGKSRNKRKQHTYFRLCYNCFSMVSDGGSDRNQPVVICKQ